MSYLSTRSLRFQLSLAFGGLMLLNVILAVAGIGLMETVRNSMPDEAISSR